MEETLCDGKNRSQCAFEQLQSHKYMNGTLTCKPAIFGQQYKGKKFLDYLVGLETVSVFKGHQCPRPCALPEQEINFPIGQTIGKSTVTAFLGVGTQQISEKIASYSAASAPKRVNYF